MHLHDLSRTQPTQAEELMRKPLQRMQTHDDNKTENDIKKPSLRCRYDDYLPRNARMIIRTHAGENHQVPPNRCSNENYPKPSIQ